MKVKCDHRSKCTGRYELNKLTSLPMCGFIAQLVEHRTGIAEVTGSNPVEALIFFRLLLSNCLNWKIYCDDHSSLLKCYLFSWLTCKLDGASCLISSHSSSCPAGHLRLCVPWTLFIKSMWHTLTIVKCTLNKLCLRVILFSKPSQMSMTSNSLCNRQQ